MLLLNLRSFVERACLHRRAAAALLSFALANMVSPCFAGEVVITWVSEKQQPLKNVESLVADDDTLNQQMEVLRRTMGEKAAKQLEQTTIMARQSSAQIDRDLTRYSFGIANSDLVRRATSVDVTIDLYDHNGRVAGSLDRHFDLTLEPKEDTTLSFECEDDLCRNSSSATVEITGVDMVDLKFGSGEELAFEWSGRRWFLADNWQSEGTLELRTFSASAYSKKPFDDLAFPSGGLEPDTKHYHRLREETPARYPEDSIAYEFEQGDAPRVYAYGLLPGFVIKKGRRAKPSFLDVDISNVVIDGRLTAGELVQIRATQANKKAFLVVISPVCSLRSRHRRLRAKIRFAFDKATMKVPEIQTIERAVADWLEPVSIAEVAKQCGPNSGTPVKRWTKETTRAEVENQLGAPDASSETRNGEVLVYGVLKLRFQRGRLAGYERRSS